MGGIQCTPPAKILSARMFHVVMRMSQPVSITQQHQYPFSATRDHYQLQSSLINELNTWVAKPCHFLLFVYYSHTSPSKDRGVHGVCGGDGFRQAAMPTQSAFHIDEFESSARTMYKQYMRGSGCLQGVKMKSVMWGSVRYLIPVLESRDILDSG